ncbi:hypothetical protein GKQ77_08510 [Streptomyces sp. BG9H]|uniref:Uncharacterized protein n=1 Tax=Streptomyces anatolicus TaxID=2675858 RepID=A0ABS6YJI9_9ACTN|nr:DUF6185 family protein [Streptomyces anatolicus]MBW5421608.1 hypothetical protein [Streptomyces anatolicus]
MLLLVVFCAVLWPAPAGAEAEPGGVREKPVDRWCATAGLDKAKASAAIRLAHGGTVHTKVSARLTVHVPYSWRYAKSLLLSEDTSGYRRAMGCVARPFATQHRWWNEWRPKGSPRVAAEKGGLLVTLDTFSWIDEDNGEFTLGPWKVEQGTARWRLLFEPAPGLHRVNWTKILVDPGAPGAESARPEPATREGATALVWRPEGEEAPPPVAVRIAPGWQRSFAAQDDRFLFANFHHGGNLAWTFVMSGLMLYAAARLRRRAGASTLELRSARMLGDWAWVSAGTALVFDGDTIALRWLKALGDDELWTAREPRLVFAASVCTAVLLLAFGRPPRPIVGAALALTVPVLGVAFQPDLFGLPDDLDISGGTSYFAFSSLCVAGGCAQALTFLAFTAAAWRLAREGDLIPPSGKTPGVTRELLLRYAGPVIVALTLAVGACYFLAVERNWQRAAWLSRHTEALYGLQHRGELRGHVTWFIVNSQNWWLTVWLLTGLALFAALRGAAARPSTTITPPPGAAPPPGSLADEPEGRRLLLLFFPVIVGMSLGYFANNAVLSALWIFFNMAALRLVIALGARRAVLHRVLESSPSKERLGVTVTAARRADILGRARRYREIHAKMRRLDQGQSDDDILQRRLLEQEVRGLHAWTDSAGATGRLPAQVSVVDVALALGPRDTWWDNGRRAAVIACFFGIPASAVVVWSGWIRGDQWRANLYYGFGLPDTVEGFLLWQTCWAGAGFVLGALWRSLPGRRGPVKALAVAAAFALPAVPEALGNFAVDQGHGDLVLIVVTMLPVLTLTGIALDLEIFQGERRFWQSRVGLLLSIYQMRYFSLQLAYLVAQAVALVTLWQFFADTGGGPPPKEFEGGGGR